MTEPLTPWTKGYARELVLGTHPTATLIVDGPWLLYRCPAHGVEAHYKVTAPIPSDDAAAEIRGFSDVCLMECRARRTRKN